MIGKACIPHVVNVETVRGSDSETEWKQSVCLVISDLCRAKELVLWPSPERLISVERTAVHAQARQWTCVRAEHKGGVIFLGLQGCHDIPLRCTHSRVWIRLLDLCGTGLYYLTNCVIWT